MSATGVRVETMMEALVERVIELASEGLFIDGTWCAAESCATMPVTDPATGSVLAEIADAGAGDGARALSAAAVAAGDWADTSPRHRSEVLRRAYEALRASRDDFATLISLEMGKPLREAEGEVSYAAEYLLWYAEEAVRINGRFTTSPDGARSIMTLRRPVGPCLMITPWNFPLAIPVRKVAAALAAGCTAVLKPAPQTPLSSLALGRLLLEAGLPRGVLNVLPTSQAPALCSPLLHDPRLRKLSFTGSTAVGRELIAQSGPQVLRTSMELGGNAPFLVFEDADIEAAVDGALIAKMRNMGQACTAANRFLVHQGVLEEFVEGFRSRLAGLRSGSGLQEASDVGPLIDAAAVDKVHRLVTGAVDGGARCLIGGEPVQGPGSFYPPTLLVDVPRDTEMACSELFGPVAPIFAFSQERDAVAFANDTDYGLVAYAYTDSQRRAARLTRSLEVGMLALNLGAVADPVAPFGGIKQSGFGREGGPEGIAGYLETTYVAAPRERPLRPEPASAHDVLERAGR